MANLIDRIVERIRRATGRDTETLREVREWRLSHLFVAVFEHMGEQRLGELELTAANIAAYVKDHPGGEWRAPAPAKAWKKLYKWVEACECPPEVTYSRRGGPRRLAFSGDRERIIAKRMDPPDSPGEGMQHQVSPSPAAQREPTE